MNKLKLVSGIAAALIVGACTKDLIVDDIKNATITILAPANNTKTAVNAVTFWWEVVEGAEKYNIQIVKPNFGAVQTLVTDTNIVGNKYTRSLTPGVYQWRIKAYNAGGSTAYTVFNLSIDTTSNLSGQLVVPVSPLTGYLTASRSNTLIWTGIPSATHYQLQIMEGNSMLKDTTTSNTNYMFSAATASNNVGVFSWKVKAFNNTSVSQFNTAQTFTVDRKAPNQPALTSPANLTSHTTSVTLIWARNNQTIGDVRYDSIYVATDSTFPGFAIVASARVNGTQINTAAFTPSVGPNGTLTEKYFWKVRSIDSLGNASPFSNWLKFRINP